MLGTSIFTAWRTLRRERLHPYHYRWVQALLPEDVEEIFGNGFWIEAQDQELI
jgi:hypothetical protein